VTKCSNYQCLHYVSFFSLLEPRWPNRYSDCLRPRRQRAWSSSSSRAKNFHYSISFRPALEPNQPSIIWVPGVLSPGLKWQGLEADYSPPTSAKVKKMWIYTSIPSYAFMAYCLIAELYGTHSLSRWILSLDFRNWNLIFIFGFQEYAAFSIEDLQFRQILQLLFSMSVWRFLCKVSLALHTFCWALASFQFLSPLHSR
jgi:hypothetical protein